MKRTFQWAIKSVGFSFGLVLIVLLGLAWVFIPAVLGILIMGFERCRFDCARLLKRKRQIEPTGLRG